ncbi:hypothetical protein [Sporosarcina sp. YIM B06819]|uniref:hypothetical protein n=1 Tax=Sporosarcina sp. YIM B06819 TaxID=3081769 RepID=UPI00298C3B97|nr:hypothetical protein [Sporosarcina sp. YIM B06819]
MKKLKEQLQSLTFKQKLEHIIEYYSFHVIGAIVIAFFLVMAIITFTNQPIEILSVRVVKADITSEQTKGLQIELEKSLIKNDKEMLSIRAINMSDVSNNPDSLLTIQKLAAEIAGKEVDVLLVDKDVFQQFNEDGNLYDLSNFHVFDDWKTRKYPSVKDPGTITGIDVSNVPYLSSIVTKSEPLLFVVMANTERLDKVKEFVNFFNE